MLCVLCGKEFWLLCRTIPYHIHSHIAKKCTFAAVLCQKKCGHHQK